MRTLAPRLHRKHLRVSGGWDEVEESMNPVVAEAGVTLDTRLLREDVVVLALEVANDFLEAGNDCLDATERRRAAYIRKLIVDVVTKSRSINNCKGNPDTVLLQLC